MCPLCKSYLVRLQNVSGLSKQEALEYYEENFDRYMAPYACTCPVELETIQASEPVVGPEMVQWELVPFDFAASFEKMTREMIEWNNAQKKDLVKDLPSRRSVGVLNRKGPILQVGKLGVTLVYLRKRPRISKDTRN
jgi:hypothetical protein